MNQVPESDVPEDDVSGRDVDVPSERRCWRCLQMFACPPEDVARAELDFWLCDACRTALVPNSRQRR